MARDKDALSELLNALRAGGDLDVVVSTRKVDGLVRALGIDAGISKSAGSRICAELDEHLGAFRDRSLGHSGFPCLFLDGHLA